MRNAAVPALVVLLLAGLLPQHVSAADKARGGYLERVRYHVNVRNDSNKCVWLTPYWANPASKFSIMDGGPRVLGSHQTTQINYTTPVQIHTNVQMEVRLRAEFFAINCGGGNAGDKQADSYGTPKGEDNDLTVNATVSGDGHDDPYGIYIGSIGHKH